MQTAETAEQMPVVIPAVQRIMAEGDAGGNWTAWFEDDPEGTRGGGFPILAVDALLKARPERVPDYYSVSADPECRAQRYMEFALTFWAAGRDLP